MIGQLVGTIHQSWKSFAHRHRNFIVFGVFLVLGLAVWQTFPGATLADTTPPATTPAAGAPTTGAAAASGADNASTVADWFVGTISKIFLGLARLCISLTIFILTFIIEVASYNGFLDASAVSVGWVMVRDITNMGFVVILLIIAFGTILGIEKYEWKKMLVKMVMAAILVNFSRTICGVIIDVAQVVMITFVNGVAATAGGNLIRMFNLDSIRDLSSSQDPKTFTNVNFLIASIGALVFSAMAMAMMLAFLVMLLARMIVLWVLIVLSPLAFVLSVLPQTEGYADKWWSQFGSNVVTGPALMFFVWLSFVTVGNGKINDEIAGAGPKANGVEAQNVMTGDGKSSGISAAWDWNNMANFAIAIGMLMVGAKVASELGGIGGEWAGQAVDFGKKVGYYASGAAAARYAVNNPGKVISAARYVPGIGLAANAAISGYGKVKEKFYDVQKWRNDRAKDFGKGDKAHRDLEIKRQDKQITEEDYQKQKKELNAKHGIGSRILGRLGEAAIETDARGRKKAEDSLEAAEANKDAYLGDFSTSSYGAGRRKYLAEVKAEQVKERGMSKKEDKKAMIRFGMLEKTRELAEGAHAEGETPEMKALKAEKKATEKDMKEKIEAAGGDTKLISAVEKEGYSKLADISKKIKKAQPIKEELGEDLMFTTIKSKENEHANAAALGAVTEQVKAGFAHTKEGENIHAKAAAAQMGTQTFKWELDTHQAQLQLDLLMGKKVEGSDGKKVAIGADFITSRAKYDAQTGAQQTAQQERLSDVREARARDAQRKIEDIRNDTQYTTPDQREVQIRKLSETNGEVASAYFTSLKKQNETLELQSRGLLNEGVMQAVVADRQDIDLGEVADVAATQSIEKEMEVTSKKQLLDAQAVREQNLAIKTQRARAGEIPYTEKEQETDRLWGRAIQNKIWKISNIDDLTAYPDTAVVGGTMSHAEDTYGIMREKLQATIGALGTKRIEGVDGVSNGQELVRKLAGIVDASERSKLVNTAMQKWAEMDRGEQGGGELDRQMVARYFAQIVEGVRTGHAGSERFTSEIS